MARSAQVVRNTKETQIEISLDLDGTGLSDVVTGIGFFDHMLDSLARHGGFDLRWTPSCSRNSTTPLP